MKRFIIIFIFMLSLYPVEKAYSAPFTFQLDIGVLSRDIVEEGGQLVGFNISGDAVSTRILAKFGVSPSERLQIYAQIGATDLSISDFNNYDADLSLAYGGGLTLTMYRSPAPPVLSLFADVNVLRFVSQDKVETIVAGSPVVQDEEITWTEYVFAIGVSSRHMGLEPYGGIRLSFVDGKDELSQSGELDFKEDSSFGLFLGANIFLDPSEKTALRIEGNILDQYSISAGVRVGF